MKKMSGLREIKKLKYWLENKDSYIGWYSQKQKDQMRHNYKHCANIYHTPEGKEVEVTSVTNQYTSECQFDDLKMVGPVVKWVRAVYNDHKYF